jgi:hypothetical protein
MKMHLRQSFRFGGGLGYVRDATTDLIGRDLGLDKSHIFTEEQVANGMLSELSKS